MTHAVSWMLLVSVSSAAAFGQVISNDSGEDHFSIGVGIGGPITTSRGSDSPSSERGPANFEGVLARADRETLSVELQDQRFIRFQINDKTQYVPSGSEQRLSAFHIGDFVSVKADVKGDGYYVARRVRYLRKPTPAEQAEILQSPEMNYRVDDNLIGDAREDNALETRKLSLVAKPAAIALGGKATASTDGDDLIATLRATVNETFEGLPNFRAKEITSMFHSTSKNIKWVPNGVLSAEIAYEGDRESYTEIQLNGKRPANAPVRANSEYMRSFHNAWSTGDFEGIAHCVFAGLDDADFQKTNTERHPDGDLAVYEFTGGRASTCVAVRSASQVAYPSYRGSLKVNLATKRLTHIELEATGLPPAFPLDRAERSVDFALVRIGAADYLLPTTAYWFGCYHNSYSCFLNRVDFRDYRRFSSDSVIRFAGGSE